MKHKMKILCCICIMMSLCRHSFAVDEGTTTEGILSVREKVETCASKLSKFLEKLCTKSYKIIKRDTSSILLDKLIPADLENHMNKNRLISSESWRRVRRQIATECCEQSCTVGNIILYCADDARLVKENPDIFYYLDDN